MQFTHLHLYTGLTGRRVWAHPPSYYGLAAKDAPHPSKHTHTHSHIHTHTQIPGLASAQCWDYRIRTLFHYLLTLYSACTHTHTQKHAHTMPHCLGQSGHAEDRHSVNQSRWLLQTWQQSYSFSSCWNKNNTLHYCCRNLELLFEEFLSKMENQE